MTTINNSENLIEKVGGIEKAREIVNGAPKGFDAYSFKEKKYVRSDWFLGEVSLNDLRTAISEQDTDNVTAIRNHVSPSTVVTDLHVNETDKLNRLG